MAEFTTAVFQNEFLPDGGTDVNAIVTISCKGAGTAGQSGSGDAGEIIIVDTSGLDGARDDGRGQGRRAGGPVRDRRRHLVRHRRGRRPGDAGLPAGDERAGPGADELRDPAGGVRRDRTVRRQRRYGDLHLARPRRPDLRVRPAGDPAARAAAHRRREPGAARPPRRGDQPRDRLLPVRLPRRRHRLAGRRDPADRPGAARHRRHHPEARRDAGPVPGDHARVDGPRGRRRQAPASGRRRAPRCCSCARSRRRSRTSPTAGSRSTR